MADFSALIASIRAQIRENGRQLITGPVMQASLLEIIDAVNGAKQDTLSFDSEPTEGSENPVTSGGVWGVTAALSNSLDNLATGVQEGYDDLLGRINGKQDIIADLADIRAGALLGATAYQRPAMGIPAGDMSDGVQRSLYLADNAVIKGPEYAGEIPVFGEDGGIEGTGITPADVVAKADQDGTYPDLTAGAVLAAAVPAEYLYRPCPAPMDGKAVLDTIMGKSLVWNQLFNKVASHENNGVTFTTNDDGSITISGEALAVAASTSTSSFSQVRDHKYLVCLKNATSDMTILGRDISGFPGISYGQEWRIATATQTGQQRVAIVVLSGADLSTPVTVWPMVVDLTLMFGAGNEPSTVEEFQAMYPAPYYAYNAGQLINNAAESIKTTGRNQWDEVTEIGGIYTSNGANNNSVTDRIRAKNYFTCFGGKTYYYRNPTAAGMPIFWYDQYKSLISYTSVSAGGGTVTAPSNAAFFRISFQASYGTTYNHDVCINISDAAFNGQYEPYKESEVQLGLNSFQVTDGTNTITVNGLKSAGSVYDEIKDGKYIKRVYTRAYQSGDESDATVITDGTNTNAPLATPIEYDLVSEIPNSYQVYEGGTEEILSDTIVAPFCASIRYPASPEGLTIVELLTSLKAASVISDFAVTVDAATSKKTLTITA